MSEQGGSDKQKQDIETLDKILNKLHYSDDSATKQEGSHSPCEDEQGQHENEEDKEDKRNKVKQQAEEGTVGNESERKTACSNTSKSGIRKPVNVTSYSDMPASSSSQVSEESNRGKSNLRSEMEEEANLSDVSEESKNEITEQEGKEKKVKEKECDDVGQKETECEKATSSLTEDFEQKDGNREEDESDEYEDYIIGEIEESIHSDDSNDINIEIEEEDVEDAEANEEVQIPDLMEEQHTSSTSEDTIIDSDITYETIEFDIDEDEDITPSDAESDTEELDVISLANSDEQDPFNLSPTGSEDSDLEENRQKNPTNTTPSKRKHSSESQDVLVEINPTSADPKKGKYSNSDSNSSETGFKRDSANKQEESCSNPDSTQEIEGSEVDLMRDDDPKCSRSLNQSSFVGYVMCTQVLNKSEDWSGLDILDIEKNFTVSTLKYSSKQNVKTALKDSGGGEVDSQESVYQRISISEEEQTNDCNIVVGMSSDDNFSAPRPSDRKRKASSSDSVTDSCPGSNKILIRTHSPKFNNIASPKDKAVILYQNESFRQLLSSRSVQPSISNSSNLEIRSPLKELTIGDSILDTTQFTPLPSPPLDIGTRPNNQQLDERITELDAPTPGYLKLPPVPQISVPEEDDTTQVPRRPPEPQTYDSSSSESTSISDRTVSSPSSSHEDNESAPIAMVTLGPNGTTIPQVVYDGINWTNYVHAVRILSDAAYCNRRKPSSEDQQRCPELDDILYIVVKKCRVEEGEVLKISTMLNKERDKRGGKRLGEAAEDADDESSSSDKENSTGKSNSRNHGK